MSDALFDFDEPTPNLCPKCGHSLNDGTCLWCNPLPVLPYAGTSGWSGSDTSKARAVTADRDGTTTARQMRTLSLLRDAGVTGLTWKEMSDITGEHHGQVTGSLSNLHKEGLIARLSESRLRCKVYVLPENVNGRDTESQGRKPSDRSSDSPVPVPADASPSHADDCANLTGGFQCDCGAA
jgi:hypothetical protein